MNAKTRIWRGFPVLTLVLLWWVALASVTRGAEEQAIELRLIKEEQLDIPPGPSLRFLGYPEYISSGRGKFAPVLLPKQEGKPRAIRADGMDTPYPWLAYKSISNILYNPKAGVVGYIQHSGGWSDTKFVVKDMDANTLWEVEKSCLEKARVTEVGTVILLRLLFEDYEGYCAVGVYVYNLHNGELLNAFEGTKLLIESYKFSGDGNRLVFEYEIYNPDKTEDEIIDPRMRLACMDANGQLLWDIEVKSVNRMFLSYRGDLVSYITEDPLSFLKEKLGKELYAKVGLIDESGKILWEVDNPSGIKNPRIFPGGKYYSTMLYPDQMKMWDPTTKQGSLRSALFDASTHETIWSADQDTQFPQLKQGWSRTDGTGLLADDRWSVSAFCEEGYQWRDGPLRSLIVLRDVVASKIVHQQELAGRITNVLISRDSRVVELLFWDRRRMLLERVP
ncbi:hypothetical protein ACFL6S_01975 [Candidatus Poribacteria bacterium]